MEAIIVTVTTKLNLVKCSVIFLITFTYSFIHQHALVFEKKLIGGHHVSNCLYLIRRKKVLTSPWRKDNKSNNIIYSLRIFNSRVVQFGNPCHPVGQEHVFGAEQICFSEQVGLVHFAGKFVQGETQFRIITIQRFVVNQSMKHYQKHLHGKQSSKNSVILEWVCSIATEYRRNIAIGHWYVCNLTDSVISIIHMQLPE